MPVETDASILTARLKAEAARLGFDHVGVAPAVRPAGFDRYEEWLERGHAAGMDYLRRQAAARSHPDSILPGARSVIVAALIYGHGAEGPPGPTAGKVARYARGAD